MRVQIFKKLGVPGNPIGPKIAAGHHALRIIDGKADIIPADVGYYLPAENWARVIQSEGTPVQPWHIGVHWVPMLTGNRAIDSFTYGLPDDVEVWTGDPAAAVRLALGR